MRLNKVQRLAIAAAVSPSARRGEWAARRVARLDASGNVVGWTDLEAVRAALLRRHEIEVATVDETTRTCETCSVAFRPGRGEGRAKRCARCRRRERDALAGEKAFVCDLCRSPTVSPSGPGKRRTRCEACSRPQCAACGQVATYHRSTAQLKQQLDLYGDVRCRPCRDEQRRAARAAASACVDCGKGVGRSTFVRARETGRALLCLTCERRARRGKPVEK